VLLWRLPIRGGRKIKLGTKKLFSKSVGPHILICAQVGW
jgi:hypothetical protein